MVISVLRLRGFEWFKEGREEVMDDPCPGQPRTSNTNENIEKVSSIIQNDCRLNICDIDEMFNIDKEVVRKILHKNLNMSSVFEIGTENSYT
ncbi:UNVERIFIED_CONTAM: hypothetical protein RMT77_017251 [Armadillidium vulgare]